MGDNLNKDFQAPRQLGMRCIYFENRDGLYYSAEADSEDCDAKIEQISDAICVML